MPVDMHVYRCTVLSREKYETDAASGHKGGRMPCKLIGQHWRDISWQCYRNMGKARNNFEGTLHSRTRRNFNVEGFQTGPSGLAASSEPSLCRSENEEGTIFSNVSTTARSCFLRPFPSTTRILHLSRSEQKFLRESREWEYSLEVPS